MAQADRDLHDAESRVLLDAMQHWGMLDKPPRHKATHARTDAASRIGRTHAGEEPSDVDRPAAARQRPLSQSQHPTQKLRFVTAASLFDGHDAAINIMRRVLQSLQGAEVIHLGHKLLGR